MTSKNRTDHAGSPCTGDLPLVCNQNGAAAMLQSEDGKAIWVPVFGARRNEPPGLRYDTEGSPHARAFFVSMLAGVPRHLHERWLLDCYVTMLTRGHWSYNLAMEQRLADFEADAQSDIPPPPSPTYIQ